MKPSVSGEEGEERVATATDSRGSALGVPGGCASRSVRRQRFGTLSHFYVECITYIAEFYITACLLLFVAPPDI